MTEEQKTWKARLAALGVSQLAFATMHGIDHITLCNYVNLKREPRAEMHQKIERLICEMEKSK